MKKTVDTSKSLSKENIESFLAEAEKEAVEELKQEDSTLTMGAIGCPYMVGPIDITVALGNIVLLNEIDSPFVKDMGEEGTELDAVECIKSLYVLALGKEAIRPIMAIKQRIQGLMMLKPMVENNPALFESIMDRTEKISSAHADFEITAMEWYNENFVGWDFQDVMDDVQIALCDILKTTDDMPEPKEKKKA